MDTERQFQIGQSLKFLDSFGCVKDTEYVVTEEELSARVPGHYVGVLVKNREKILEVIKRLIPCNKWENEQTGILNLHHANEWHNSRRQSRSLNQQDMRLRVSFADLHGHPLVTALIGDTYEDDDNYNDHLDPHEHLDTHMGGWYEHAMEEALPLSGFSMTDITLDFERKVREKGVQLENIVLNEDLRLVGTVRVSNLAYDKSVSVRCTFNNWIDYTDYEANHVIHLGRQDVFAFEIPLRDALNGYTGGVWPYIELCVCYRVWGHELWDNNGGYGVNYTIGYRPLKKGDQVVYVWSEYSLWTVSREIDTMIPYY